VGGGEETAPADSADAGVPDWLSDVGGGEEPAPADSADAGVPDWLSDVGGGEETAPADSADAGVPDWLSDVGGGEEPAAGEPADAGVPDWLSDVGNESQPDHATLPSATRAEDAGVPDWLSDIGEDDTSASSDEEMPDWLADDTSSSTAGIEQGAADAGIPDWLAGESDAPAQEAAPADAGFPDWLADDSDTSGQSAPTSADAGVPDWLSDDSDTSGQSAPTSADAGVPDWLSDVSGGEETSDSTATEPADAGVPDWLAGESDAPAQEAAPADAGFPDWLADDSDAPAQEAAPVDAGIPDWLAGESDAPAQDAAPAADAGVPDWLAGESDAPAQDAAPAAEGGIPDWLGAEETADQEPAHSHDSGLPAWLSGGETGGTEEETSSGTETGFSDWFGSEDDQTFDAASSGGAGLPNWLSGEGEDRSSAAPATGLPDWLAGAEDDQGTAEAAPAEAVLPDWIGSEDASSGDEEIPEQGGGGGLPDWLQGSGSSAQPAAESDAGGEFGSWFDDDSSVPQPQWLRAPESTPLVEEEKEEPKQADWRKNLGLYEEEIDSVAETEMAPAMVLPRPTFPRSQTRIQAASLLQRLAAQPFPETSTAVEPATSTVLQRIGLDRVLYVVLVLLLFVGLLFPSVTGGLQDSDMLAVPAASGASEVFAEVETLSEENVVLLAYEWDGQHKSELVPLERALTQHLIDQRTHMMLISTDPQGTMLSFDLREPMQAAGYHGQGLDYLLLGYRPGGELALRMMAQDFRRVISTEFAGRDAQMSVLVTNLETGEPRLQSLNDLGMIVVLADTVQDVQGWMEQVYRNLEPDVQNPQEKAVPIVFLLPSEVAPFVQPYLKQPGVMSMIGKQAALSYSARFGGTRQDLEQVAQANGQYHFATLVFIVLVILGAIVRAVAAIKK
jgi:hypothetical protein